MSSTPITTETIMDEIRRLPGMEEVFPLFIGGSEDLKPTMTLQSIEKEHPTWNAKDMLKGILRLQEIAESGEPFIYSVYNSNETEKDEQKKNVKLIYFPADEVKTCVILAAGGAYGGVCSLAESFPVAARLNELGIPVFCLNYRVGPPNLMPKPMEDMAAAVTYLKEHEKHFSIDMDHYAAGGFSAGGHLAAAWGTMHLGARKYGLQQPEILMLDYPMISMWKTIKLMPEHIAHYLLQGYFGEDYSEAVCQPYNVDENIDEGYPPVYIVQAEDDDTVPSWNAELLKLALARNHVAYRYETPEHGGHGFGLGSETGADGWVDRAIAYWKSMK